jgi:hypothetical protein
VSGGKTPRFECACSHCRQWRNRYETTALACASLEKAVTMATFDQIELIRSLRDAVALIEKLQHGGGSWTLAEVKKLEAIRLLSLGV